MCFFWGRLSKCGAPSKQVGQTPLGISPEIEHPGQADGIKPITETVTQNPSEVPEGYTIKEQFPSDYATASVLVVEWIS